MPYTFIKRIEREFVRFNSKSYIRLKLSLKDVRKLTFIGNASELEDFYKIIYQQAFFERNIKEFCFAFPHFQAKKWIEEKYQGWKIYDIVKEFMR